LKIRIGIKDIAKKAGVSKGTVDRVLHNRGNVSPDARKKVEAAMEELDYQPNMIASALASKKTKKVAVLIPDSKNDPFWEQPTVGILKAKKTLRDYPITINEYYFRDADPQHFLELGEKIIAGKYHAVLISPSYYQEASTILKKLELNNIPYVQINTFLSRDSEHFLAYIGQDSYASGILAAKLINFGIDDEGSAMILHLEKDIYNAKHLVDKENGFNDFFKNHKRENLKIVHASFGDIFQKDALKNYLKNTLDSHPNVKGIFVTTSRTFHIVPTLNELNRTDIKLVGFDLIENNLKHLHEDSIHFLINQNPQKQGFLGIMNLFNHLFLKKEIKHIQMLPLDVVMKENVEYYLEEKNQDLHIVL